MRSVWWHFPVLLSIVRDFSTSLRTFAAVVQSLNHIQLFATPWTAAHQAPLSWISSDSCPFSRWCHPNISSSVAPFSFCLQSFSASESFPMSQLFTIGSQNIWASASATVLPMNIQGWFPLGLIGLRQTNPGDSQESSPAPLSSGEVSTCSMAGTLVNFGNVCIAEMNTGKCFCS